jgi:hypothetical protein
LPPSSSEFGGQRQSGGVPTTPQAVASGAGAPLGLVWLPHMPGAVVLSGEVLGAGFAVGMAP